MKNTYKMRKNLLGFINECLLFRTDVTEFERQIEFYYGKSKSQVVQMRLDFNCA